MARFRMVCYCIAVILTAVGCAPTAAPKPSTPSSSASAGSQGGGRGQGEGKRGATGESTTPPGSLDALRKGESSATAASSPLKDIFFDFDRYDLKAEARDILKTNADWLKGNASSRIEIEGHCDSRGTAEYNLALGAKRAQAAKDYLATLGISPERLSTISYGAEIPVCREENESCWSRNRRARFVIVPGRPAS